MSKSNPLKTFVVARSANEEAELKMQAKKKDGKSAKKDKVEATANASTVNDS